MSQPSSTALIRNPSAEDLQRRVMERIDTLSYLPTTAAVAMKFVELGKNPDAEPADYAKVISADSSLSSKLLALANSSWAGVRTKVTTVKMAVNLLGLGTVRTLAISYCMTGLHNELRLSPEESEMFWESALSKAVAAKQYAARLEAKCGDEAFVAGLFQDFALPLLYSVVREPYRRLLENPQTNIESQLEQERKLFGIDHAEVGRALAQKLELPELFIDVVAFHHNYERLTELVESAVLRDAARVASFLPHALGSWCKQDADALDAFLRAQAPAVETAGFVNQVQAEFAKLYAFFNQGKVPHAQLVQLLTQTAKEAADNTTELVGQVNELLREAASMGMAVRDRVQELENEAHRDPLTGALNRQGFLARAKDVLNQAARYGLSLAVGYLDIDQFKLLNDQMGHAFGDQVLQQLAAQVQAALPKEAVFGRLGGDEFALVLSGCAPQDAQALAELMATAIRDNPVRRGTESRQILISLGMLYVKPGRQAPPMEKLLNAADKLMYAAKRGGGNRVEFRAV